MMTGMAAMAAATLLQTALLARELGTSGLGIIASVIAVTTITSALVSFRTTEALTRWLAERAIKRSSRAMAALISSALSAEIVPRSTALIILLMLSPVFAGLFTNGEAHTSLFMLHSITILLTVPQTVWMSLMREERRFALIAGSEAGIAFARLGALTVAAATNNLTITLAVAIIVLSAFGKSIYQSLQIHQSLSRRRCGTLGIKAAWKARRRLNEFWKLMGSGYLASTFIAPFKYGDVLLLGAFTTTSDVGLYKVAKTIITLLQTACNTLATILFQDMNDALRSGAPGKLRNFLLQITTIWTPILILIVGVSVSLASKAIPIIFGIEYSEAALLYYILIAGAFVWLLFFWSMQLSIAIDAYSTTLPIFYTSQVFVYCIMTYGVWKYGVIGLSAAISLHWALTMIVFLPFSLKKLSRIAKTFP